MGSLRLVALGLLVAVVASGCGGNRDRDRYRDSLAAPLLRLDRAAGSAVRTISAFEGGRVSFRKAHVGVTSAAQQVAAAGKVIAGVDAPPHYAVAQRGLQHSVVLLSESLVAYDQYLHEFVSAVVAFRHTKAGSVQAAQATARYRDYVRLLRGFQSVAGTSSEAAGGAIRLSPSVLSYRPQPTVVYVTEKGVFAGAPAAH